MTVHRPDPKTRVKTTRVLAEVLLRAELSALLHRHAINVDIRLDRTVDRH